MGLKAIGYAQTIIGYIGGLFSPASLNPRQWLFSQTEPDEVDDKSTNLIDANYVGSPATVWDGVAGILVTELVGSETVVSSGGTSTPSISAGQIDFTSGTCWDLVLSNGSVYPLQEESGSSVYDTVNGYTGTINGGTVSVICTRVQCGQNTKSSGKVGSGSLSCSLASNALAKGVLPKDNTLSRPFSPQARQESNPPSGRFSETSCTI